MMKSHFHCFSTFSEYLLSKLWFSK